MYVSYTGESKPFYNYLRPFTSLDEGCMLWHMRRMPPRFRATIEEITNEPDSIATVEHRSKKMPPRFRATIKEITDEPDSIATVEHRSKKMLLLTWNAFSEPTEEPVYEYIIPRSLVKHDYNTPFEDFITPRCIPHCMLTHPYDESVIAYTQLTCVIDDVMRKLSFEETKLDGEACFTDVKGNSVESYSLSHDESFGVDDLDLNLNEPVNLNVSQIETQSKLHVSEDPDVSRSQEPIMEEGKGQFFYNDEGIDIAYETEYDVHSSKDACTYDDDDDEDFLVDEENEIVEPDVDVHLFGISMGQRTSTFMKDTLYIHYSLHAILLDVFLKCNHWLVPTSNYFTIKDLTDVVE
nr:hypothetical protein [Tanacetum cinerariifolium]